MKTFFTSLRTFTDSLIFGVLAFLFWLSIVNASAQTITTGTITSNNTPNVFFCANSNYPIEIPFTVAGSFGTGNITYRAVLSNANGNFDSGTTLLKEIVTPVGSTGGGSSDVIATTVPPGLPWSSQYRIKVQKVNPTPIVDGSDNGRNLYFGVLITATYPNPLGPYCVGDPISVPYALNCQDIDQITLTLQLSNAAGSFASPTTINSVTTTANGTITGNFPNVPSGTGYMMRIVSDAPAEISNTSLPFLLGNGTLTTMKANGSVYCQGETLNLAYGFNATDPINAGNVYSVQLSNNNFATLTTIGTLASSAKTGSIQAVIPNNIAGSNYEIRVVASNGPLSGCEYGLYTIAALPTLPVVSLGNSPVCAGSNASFTVSGTAGTTLTYTLTGVPGNQTLLLNGSNQTITANNANADVTLTLVSVSNVNCTLPLSTTATVTVTPLPTANISYAGTPFCKSLSTAAVTLTGTHAYTVGSYSSTAGLSINSTTGEINPSASTAGTYSITYTIAPAGGCGQVQASTSVSINPLPTAVISGTTAVCQNAPFPQITFTGSNGATPYTFTYQINDTDNLTVSTTVGTGVSISQTTAMAGVFAYSLVSVKDANGCNQSQNGTATITVNAPPVVSTPHTELCTGQPLMLSPNSNGTWLSSNPTIASVSNEGLVTGLSAGAVNFTFTATATGCAATTNNIIVKPTPSSNLTASQTDVCPNTEVTLNPNCSIPTATVNWNPGAPTVTPNAATLPYIYKAFCAWEGCVGNESSVEVRTHRILIDMKDLDVGTLPLPIARAVKDNMAPTNLIEAPVFPRRWTFIAKGCDASESAVFKLSGPVNFQAIDNAPTYALFANDAGGFYAIDHPNYGNGGSFPNGIYTLTVDLRSQDGVGGPFPKNRVATGSLLASRTLQFTVIGPSNVSYSARGSIEKKSETELTDDNWIRLGQNPINAQIAVQLSGKIGEEIVLSLINVQGQIIQQKSITLFTFRQHELMEAGNAAEGMYFLKAIKGGNIKTFKVLKTE